MESKMTGLAILRLDELEFKKTVARDKVIT